MWGVWSREYLATWQSVWRSRGQSSHLSFLIKTTGICMTALSPHLFLLNQRILKKGYVKAVAENGAWWYVYHRVTLLKSDQWPLTALIGGLYPFLSLVYHQPSFIHLPGYVFFFFSFGPGKLLHLQLYPRLCTIWYWLLLQGICRLELPALPLRLCFVLPPEMEW